MDTKKHKIDYLEIFIFLSLVFIILPFAVYMAFQTKGNGDTLACCILSFIFLKWQIGGSLETLIENKKETGSYFLTESIENNKKIK